MIASTDYPDLRNFLACAFHQDWEETADTYERVVDIDVAAEEGFREAKRITSEDHRTNDARVAAHQGKPWFGFVRACLAET